MLRIFLLALLAVLPASACLWDRDTLQEEAKGKLDTVKAITGWFDRYPARYYEMRLDRVSRELEEKPDALDLYDDAGVACSRLRRHDEAIAWMEKKKAALDSKSAEETEGDRYRYLSNIGTFYLIRWIVQPEEKRGADLTDLTASETFIKQALELNPDAHFGREKFQLRLIQWLLGKAPRFEGRLSPTFLYPPKNSGKVDFTPEEATKAITGLIQLGAAWESVDSFCSLTISINRESKHHLAALAGLRHEELSMAGMKSLHPDPEIRKLVKPLIATSDQEQEAMIRGYYEKARAAAREREVAWLAYQEARYAKGMHPDTHADFWKDWKEHDLPKMPGPTFPERLRRHPVPWAIGALVALYLLQFPVRLISKRRKKTLEAAAA